MARSDFIKRNGLLILGITLPFLMMILFMSLSLLPLHIPNPPQYDMIFSVNDYSSNIRSPVDANFIVTNGVLKVQYMRNTSNSYTNWKKLYIYDAKTLKVKQLEFPLPKNIEKIQQMTEQTVDSTKNLKLDTTLESPDGYLLSYQDDSNGGGLLGSLLWGNYGNEACLKKGSTCIKLVGNGRRAYFYPGYIQFIGWVKP